MSFFFSLSSCLAVSPSPSLFFSYFLFFSTSTIAVNLSVPVSQFLKAQSSFLVACSLYQFHMFLILLVCSPAFLFLVVMSMLLSLVDQSLAGFQLARPFLPFVASTFTRVPTPPSLLSGKQHLSLFLL